MYDDDENNELYEDETGRKIKKAGKDALNTAKNKGKRELKELVKKIFKSIGLKWLIIVGIIIAVIISIASFWWAIKKQAFDEMSKMAKESTSDSSGQVKKITQIDEDKREIKVDSDTYIENVKDYLKRAGINPTELGFYDDDYSTLVTFLQAEAVSSFPDLRERNKIGTPVKKGELQGTIQFNRKYKDGSEQLLEFMKYTDYRKELAKFGVKLDEEETQEQEYFDKASVESAYNSLKTYFTLDEDYNLIIATLSSNEQKVTYSSYAKEEGMQDDYSYDFTIDVSRIDYQSVVQKYTMPFEYPLAFLMISANPHFCEEIAKLAMLKEEGEEENGAAFTPKIVVDVQDNAMDTYTKEDYGYTANFKLEKYVKYKVTVKNDKGQVVTEQGGYQLDGNPITIEKTVSAASYKVTEDWNNTTTEQLCISEADTWIQHYTSVYEKVDEPTENETTSTEGDDGDYREVADSHGYLKNAQFTYSLPSSASKNTSYSEDSSETKIKEKDADKKTTITTQITTTKYEKSSSKVIPKWERFLSLLKVESEKRVFNLNDLSKNDEYIYYTIEDGQKRKASPDSNLLSAEVALYELIASNDKTVSLEEITRDLFDIYTGRKKVSEIDYDFSIYEPSEFTTTSGYYYGGSFEEKVWFALRDAGYDEYATAGAMGNFMQESGFKSNNVQNEYESRVGSDEVYTQKVNSGAYSRQQFMSDSVGYGLAQWTFPTRKANLYDFAKSKGVGIDDEDMQIEFILKEMNQHGYSKNQTNISTATVEFHNKVENSADTVLTQREIYAQEIYNKYHGKTAPEGGALTQGSSSEKLRYLYPQGVPVSKSDCEKYLTTVQVALTKKDGTKTTGNITVHQKLAADVQKALQKAQDQGFKVYSAAGYSYRQMNNGGSGKLSHHSYGVAIDINPNENYSRSGSRVFAGSFWDPSKSEFSIPRNGALVNAFREIGWSWGGNWSGNYQDYMHFSYTGH